MSQPLRDSSVSRDAIEVRVVDGLRDGEARYRALAENARDVILEITPEAVVDYVSPSLRDHFGWEPEEMIGRNALEWVHPEDLPEVDRVRSAVFETLTPAMVLFRFRTAAGPWAWVELTGRPYRNAAGGVRGVLVARDVTDRVRAEHEFEAQLEHEKAVAELARGFVALSGDDFEASILAGLETSARVAGAQRSQMYLMWEGAVRSYYGWTAPEWRDRLPAPVTEDVSRFAWAARQLTEHGEIHVPVVAELPPEAAGERAALAELGATSYLAVALHDGRGLFGFVDFYRIAGEQPWTDAEIERIRLLVGVLTGALRRLHAEDEWREAEERLRTLAREVSDIICEVGLDGRIHFVSENLEEQLGYGLEAIQGVGAVDLVHPDDLELVARGMAEAAASPHGRTLMFRVRHADGSWRWLETAPRPFEARGGDIRLAIVIRDVTDRQTERLALEQQLDLEKRVADLSRELLEFTAQGVDAGIEHGLAVAAQLAGADRAFLTGADPDDPSSNHVYAWNGPGAATLPPGWEPGPEGFAWIRARLSARDSIAIPDTAALEDPRARGEFSRRGIRSFLGIPIHSGRRLTGVLGFHCLTRQREWSDRELATLRLLADLFTSALRRKHAEERLAESQRRLVQSQKMEAVGTLAGGIAHDFNNQLTVMLSNARYALREADPDTEVHQALGDLTRAAEHCAQLTRSLLAFSRRTPASRSALELGGVLAEAEGLLRPLIPRSIELRVAVEDGDARISADATQLQQVLVNLVVNARDAMQPEGGVLCVRCEALELGVEAAARAGLSEGAYAAIEVRDNGRGMTREVRARVFEPFFTTKPVGEGTGLGLATAYGIVEQFGGAITVESEPGNGATFRVLLPLGTATAAAALPVEAATPGSAAGTVLLVEDEAGVRRLLARTLREAGYAVLEADDGAAALRMGGGRMRDLDAVVTDVEMPVVSGIELARRLKRGRPELPVLFISGTRRNDLEGSGADASVTGSAFLEKPFSDGELLEQLQRVLTRPEEPLGADD